MPKDHGSTSAPCLAVGKQSQAWRVPPRSKGPVAKRLLFTMLPVLLLISGGTLFFLPGVESLRRDVITHKVGYGNLQLAFNESGFVQSASNTDIVCRVKSRTRGSTVASTLKWVIEDGSEVEPGDIVAVLDDSGLQEDLKAQRLAVVRARSDWAQAEENLAIVASQCEADITSTRWVLELAQIDQVKYLKADYEQARQDILGRLAAAESDVQMWRERVDWGRRMLKKGFVTPNQLASDRSGLLNSQVTLNNVREELQVLEQFTRRRTVTDLTGKVAEARRAEQRATSQALAKKLQADVDRLAKRSVYEVEQSRLRDIEAEIAKCTIRAPHAGMVVYIAPDQRRSAGQQSIIAQGEPVREGQVLMEIPDLTQMQVETQVHETMLAHVRGGERATIHVHAFPDQVLHGHVKFVSFFPSYREWIWTDVKVYPAKIVIDESGLDLKPGMTADVTIEVDKPLEHVLRAPMEAVLAPPKQGESSKCYVVTPDGPQQRDIVVGLKDTTMVEIKKGLQEGDEVVLNPTTLFMEKLDDRSMSVH